MSPLPNACPIGMLRKTWWIVAIAAIAGAAVAGGLALRTPVTYKATTSVSVDPIALQSLPRLPKVDTIIGVARSAGTAEKIARDAGLTSAQVAAGLTVTSIGQPQSRIDITFTASDPDAAKRGAETAAKVVSDEAMRLSEPVTSLIKDLVRTDERAAATMPQLARDATDQFNLWSVDRNALIDRDQLNWVEHTFAESGKVAVAESSRRRGVLTAAAGGGLAGLFLGVVLAFIRELMARRESPADA
jgi:capsular polysaccharide biosynthesis protein